jgi:hypothetical protein
MMTTRKPTGYMIRVALDADEYRELRQFALDDGTSVTAILAMCARKWLDKRRRKKLFSPVRVGGDDDRAERG